jgi:outer membrane protein TolC
MLRHHLRHFPTRCVTFARATLITLTVCVATAKASAQDTRSFTLRDVLDSTLTHHPLAEAAQARVRAAQGMRGTARSFGNPVLSYDVENAPFPGGSRMPAMPRETMATATLPLESIVQRFPRARSADAAVRAAEADARAARQQLALDASRAFFRTALAQVSVAAARDLTAWLDSVVAYNRHRVRKASPPKRTSFALSSGAIARPDATLQRPTRTCPRRAGNVPRPACFLRRRHRRRDR